ncbi:transmembrane protein [Nitzschia inconspicua]|uniref:Transmembrane protein n=1 Tax=Nitzschia inconspicua TaxID=303405 RepID=A0A9K3KZB2_9STRA|nr:transmembrane protein [Nitzschia inconspicua]
MLSSCSSKRLLRFATTKPWVPSYSHKVGGSCGGGILSTTTTTTRASFSTSRRFRPSVVKKRSKSTVAAAADASVASPSRRQLWLVFCHAAVPMIGFGFTDQTVMLQAGNAVDCTLGVTFGLSTLAAAAIGQVVSDASGVVFGSSLERIATKFGLPPTNLTTAQRALPIVARTTFAGSLLGIIAGCMLGLVNLLFIDTTRSSTLKLQAFTEEQEFEFTIEASNAIRTNATALTVKGPDIDGLLASMTAALAVRGCSIVEIHAQRVEGSEDDPSEKMINDVFYVVNRETGAQYEDEELEELAEALLDSTRAPMNINVVKAQVHELENTNSYLKQRINKLEQLMYERQITLISSSGESRHPSAA